MNALNLPTDWRDGPTDEVLGVLLATAFRQVKDEFACTDTTSPASADLDGRFDLRQIGAAIAPHVIEMFFDTRPDIVASRLVDLFGDGARSTVMSIAACLPQAPSPRADSAPRGGVAHPEPKRDGGLAGSGCVPNLP